LALFRDPQGSDEQEAIAIANDSPFGLGGSVFTADEQRGLAVAKQVSTGMMFVNHPTMVKADLPLAASAAPAMVVN
jgi:succinate-semialdehyde dehydrogenase/glutarate-semialdehyde dehydrogenase